jgi:hypothetical protein
MYDRSQWYRSLVQQLKEQDEDGILSGKYVLLVRVELGLWLLEKLGFSDEPITVLWVLLSGLPIPDTRLTGLDKQQRHAIANARILLPFSGRFNWESALREYATIHQAWRCYQVKAEELERQMAYRPDPQRYQERLIAYDAVLENNLPFAPRTITPAIADTFYFDAITKQGKRVVQIEIPEEVADMAEVTIPWFTQARSRTSWSYSQNDFLSIARAIEQLRQQRGLPTALGSQTSWVELVDKVIGYRAILADGKLADKNKVPLQLDGHAYVVGAVAAGKSTIAKLILADAALHPEKNLRITLIVGDTMSALNLADEFNSLFCAWGENPVAVPLIGRSTTDLHLQRLYRSGRFRPDHWALRWLNTACPLQGLVTDPAPDPVIPGKEPCEALYKPLKKPNQRKVYHSCPLFSVCPRKQLYRDMPAARIWITTPGALGNSSVPVQIERRKVHISEIVYEQSDLVIFDEADTVQEWFDNLFAGEVILTNGIDGLLDVEDVETAQAWVPRRTQPAPTRRWVGAERHSLAAISNILSNLTDIEQGILLRRWVGRNYFTSLTLAYKLAWRLLDLPKLEECQGLERIEADKKAQQIVRYFDQLSQRDPITMERPKGDVERNPVYRLALIMRTLIAAGDSAHNVAVSGDCQAWILDFIPNIQQTLQKLAQQKITWLAQLTPDNFKEEPPDNLETLAQRLEFALSVMILDRSIRIVFYEWYNKPENMLTDLNEHSLERSPSNLADILPVPPTGRVFGTYYSNGLEIGQSEQKNRPAPSGLSVFGYPNVGRWYILHYHELFTDLDGRRGPNVLALSGTSWLPHSSRWHIDLPPQGILDPSVEAQQAIEQSKFFYKPQYARDKKKALKPIRISGIPDKFQPIKDITKALANGQGNQDALLIQELKWLQDLAQQESQYWQDRERLLLIVNSYDQAAWAFSELKDSNSWQPGEIRYLARTETGEDEVLADDVVYRSDIEDFARTNGKILIAPLQAIGRGYNILNQYGKAAFSSIYFLTRPMPYPADTQSLARELNRRTLDWCKDPQLEAWKEQELYKKALLLRQKASEYWRKAELRSFYHTLTHEDSQGDTTYSERFDLAATTAGHIIQACGRLLRGGVPFHAYFIDAAWGPKSAQDRTLKETARTSLLTAMIEVLQEYVQEDLGKALYSSIVDALVDIQGFNPEY